MQKIHMFLDDSGVLHSNEKYFIYAGYIFTTRNERERAKKSYKKLVQQIKRETNFNGEIKAAYSKKKYKQALYEVMLPYESFYVVVENKRMPKEIMSTKEARHRFKDYALKKIIREKLLRFIRKGKLDPFQDVSLAIHIDQQLNSPKGYYNLESAIHEELCAGIENFNYEQHTYTPVLYADLHITLSFCDSASNYLIQASDIWANRVRASYAHNNKGLRARKRNTKLKLPKTAKKKKKRKQRLSVA